MLLLLAIFIIKMDKIIFHGVHHSPQVVSCKKSCLYIDLGTVHLQNDIMSRVLGGWVNGAGYRHCLEAKREHTGVFWDGSRCFCEFLVEFFTLNDGLCLSEYAL